MMTGAAEVILARDPAAGEEAKAAVAAATATVADADIDITTTD